MFPLSAPHTTGALQLDGQSVHWEESGVPDGIPALYLHGGPGGTLGRGAYRSELDPDCYVNRRRRHAVPRWRDRVGP